MTNVVLDTIRTETEAKENIDNESSISIEMSPTIQKKEDIIRKISFPIYKEACSKWFSLIFPSFLWPHRPVHLDETNQEGDTPLIIAAAQGQEEVVKALLEKGVDLNIANRSGYTAMHKAVSSFRNEIMSSLLDSGASVNSIVENGHTLLHTAVAKNFREAIVAIISSLDDIKKGKLLATKSKDDKEESALQLAVRLGDQYEGIVEHLIEHDKTWMSSKEEVIKTVYPAVAGGHKNIMVLIITKLENESLDWTHYNGDCLIKAVEENNRTAVRNIYGKNFKDLPGVSDSDKEEALSKAKELLDNHIKTNNKMESKKVTDIIDKLKSSLSNNEPVDMKEEEPESCREFRRSRSKRFTVEEATGATAAAAEAAATAKNVRKKKNEYADFVKFFKSKSHKETIKDIDSDLSIFLKFHEEFQQLKMKHP